MSSRQTVFTKLVQSELKGVTHDDVQQVALALWHENFVPDVSTFTDKQARLAGYFLDRLVRFNCVPADVKAKVALQLSKLRAFVQPELSEHGVSDKLAQAWGVSVTLKPYMQNLLDYQRRVYTHH